jgi:hypothetical protein
MRRYPRQVARGAYVVIGTQREHRLGMHVSALHTTIDGVVYGAKRGGEHLSHAEHLERVNTQTETPKAARLTEVASRKEYS